MKDDGDLRGANTGLRLIDLASIATICAMAGASVAVWQAGPPGQVPLHFDFAGRPDRFGDHIEVAKAIGVMTLVAAGVTAFCVVMERQVRDVESHRLTYRLGRIAGVAAPGFIALLMTLMAFGKIPAAQDGEALMPRLLMGGLSVLFLGVGAFLGRAKPNPVVGVRTYWSLRSRLSWDKSNRLAGRLLSLVGIAGLIAAPAAPMPAGLHLLTAGVLAAGFAAAVESWRVWRTDPART